MSSNYWNINSLKLIPYRQLWMILNKKFRIKKIFRDLKIIDEFNKLNLGILSKLDI